MWRKLAITHTSKAPRQMDCGISSCAFLLYPDRLQAMVRTRKQEHY